MKQTLLIIMAGMLVSCAGAQSKPNATVLIPRSAVNAALLPSDFAGWHKTASAPAPSSSQADDAQVLREYGLQSSESWTYQREGRKISIRALRFSDTTGGYGAFTFYRQPSMAGENICNEGASEGTRVIFYCANVLVDVHLDKITAMSAAELRELASEIPQVTGNLAEHPKLPLYLPEEARKNAKYALGPLAISKLSPDYKVAQADFSLSPEVVAANVRGLDGIANLTLVQYPTPQIAQSQVPKMGVWGATQKSSPQDGGMNQFAVRRSGPIVAVVTGNISDSDAKKLLSSINYDAEITWSEPTYNGPKDNIGNLVVNIMYLSFTIVAFMFVIGIAFGGFRIFMKKFFPGRLVDRPEDIEFIKLDLRD